MNALSFALNLSRSTSNDIVRRCANASAIKERIKELAKSWYDNSVIYNNSDKQEFIRTAVAYPNTPEAYSNKQKFQITIKQSVDSDQCKTDSYSQGGSRSVQAPLIQHVERSLN